MGGKTVLERLIQKALRQHGEPPTACPDAETLAAYVDRSLVGSQVPDVEGHLSACDTCLDQVLLCTAAPVAARRGARFDVVVRFLEHTVEILRKVAQIQIMPAPALLPTRSDGEERAALRCVRFDRHFGDLTVDVEVEASTSGLGEIRVGPSVGATLAEDVRVTLLAGRRELDSRLARGGNVSFCEVEFGDYVIRLSRPGRTLGEISLRLETG